MSPHCNPGLCSLSCSPVYPPGLSPCECGTAHLLCQLPPCCKCSPPSHPCWPLLLVWINVSSLTPWLSDFHTVRFCISVLVVFVFKFVVVLLLVVVGGTVCLPMPPSWLEVSALFFNQQNCSCNCISWEPKILIPS